MGHIYLEIIQVISACCCRHNFNLFYLQVVDKVENRQLARQKDRRVNNRQLTQFKSPSPPLEKGE
jgi:hypothetical protein